MARALIPKHHHLMWRFWTLQMPQASGIEVARWVKRIYPNVGVVVLTAYDDDPCVVAVLQAGANGYVLKTAAPAEIVQAVRDVGEVKRHLIQPLPRSW
ncbi:MAG: response regulator transcription factor [Chloroflexi bacterium]|nr:response regulator transcription factor [Chloroflexota bacterium]